MSLLRQLPPGYWKRQARTWHWMSGAVCLVGMLLFSLTGITLNHAAQIKTKPQTQQLEMSLTPSSLEILSGLGEGVADETRLPVELRRDIRRGIGVRVGDETPEWTNVDVYIPLPRPGGDAWLSIDRQTGEVFFEDTSRGAVSYLNDLHKGRNTGTAWSWFIDIFAGAAILFCLSGLWLLQMHSKRRASTWWLAAGGLVVPSVLLILFVHM